MAKVTSVTSVTSVEPKKEPKQIDELREKAKNLEGYSSSMDVRQLKALINKPLSDPEDQPIPGADLESLTEKQILKRFRKYADELEIFSEQCREYPSYKGITRDLARRLRQKL